jgi:hypothetical protein
VVAVLDQRLATARYGSYLKASLPDFWYTTDGGQARRSLAAIDEAAKKAEAAAAEAGEPPVAPETVEQADAAAVEEAADTEAADTDAAADAAAAETEGGTDATDGTEGTLPAE